MRTLMLGWEFPPRQSGGLGTACEGLATALVGIGVDVLFVAPEAVEMRGERVLAAAAGAQKSPIPSPHPPGARLPDRSGVALVREIPAFLRTAPLGRAPAPPPGHAPSHIEDARADDGMRLLRVASPLRPYQTRASYAATAQPVRATRPAAGEAPLPHSTPTDSAPDLYGSNLLAEIERYADRVADIAQHERFDVIHAHDWMTLPAALRVRERTGAPLVWHVHSTEYDRQPDEHDPAIAALEQLGLDAADRVVVVSSYTAETLARHYRVDASRIRVVHNAVDRSKFTPGATHTGAPPLVLFLGRLTAQKDPLTFVRAARLVVDALPHVRFVIGGSGDLLPELVAEVGRLALDEQVHFTGFLGGKDVQRMYALADLYVMPSRSEPFGIAALEAMCADVPVIISDATGVSEVLTNALTFERGSETALADRILSVLKHPALSQSLIEQGRREVRSLRWEVRARSLLRIYKELVA